MLEDKILELKKLGIMTPDELKEQEIRLNAIEEVAKNDVAKYFDRINDKLFSFNNMLIAGYFALIVTSSLHYLGLLIPVINMVILTLVDWYMMEYKRIESTAANNRPAENKRARKLNEKATLLSFFTIVTTLAVTGLFIWFLKENKFI